MADQPSGSGSGGGRGASRLIIVRWIVRETMGTVGTGALVFLSAGRIDWAAGWAYVLLTLAWVAGTGAVLIPRNPDLLAERLGPRKGAKAWDTAIMSVYALGLIAIYVVGGLDERHGWSVGIAPAGQIAAGVVLGLGNALVVWATASNRFFSLVVRIQTERGHTVVTAGPYRWVRHPAYVGGILIDLAGPVLLGSWWALLPGGLSALLMVVRTALEDRSLMRELPGYPDYAGRVRYRLVPGVW